MKHKPLLRVQGEKHVLPVSDVKCPSTATRRGKAHLCTALKATSETEFIYFFIKIVFQLNNIYFCQHLGAGLLP